VLQRLDNEVLRAGAALLIAVVVGVFFGRPPTAPEPSVPMPVVGVPVYSETGRVTVHVSGAVVSPGLVEISDAGRIADAIAAAGGVTGSADLTGVNLADRVSDGLQVVVPSIGVATDDVARAGPSDGKVRLNSAGRADLEGLPGVGPVLAGKIIEHRDEFGPFSSVEDLLEVSGIGERKLASLRDLVVVP
jgi:competence protein ComEA